VPAILGVVIDRRIQRTLELNAIARLPDKKKQITKAIKKAINKINKI
jgi:hypothetical protein